MMMRADNVDFDIDCGPDASPAALRLYENHFPNMAAEANGRDAPCFRAAGFTLGYGKLYSISANCRSQRRQPDKPDHVSLVFGLIIPVQGVHEISEPGRRCLVAPGSMCLIDGSRDFSVTTEVPGTALNLLIPRTAVLRRFPHFERYRTKTFDPDDSGTIMMREIVLRSFENIPRLDELQRAALVWTIVDSFGLPKLARGEAEWRVQKAINHILAHLGDSNLNAHAVARAQFISRRSLDELFFRVFGRPVAAEIMERRLTQAAEYLADPSQTSHSIGNIAYSMGFEHPAHFTRAFRRRFGTVPSIWRRDGQSVQSVNTKMTMKAIVP